MTIETGMRRPQRSAPGAPSPMVFALVVTCVEHNGLGVEPDAVGGEKDDR